MSTYAEVLDARGQVCPMPVISLAQAAAGLAVGQHVLVLSDDAAAAHDIPAWCRLRGHVFHGEVPVPDGGPGAAYDVELGAAAG